jgi:ubiquinone/menaquinone biosynthesis C-methylase UbiE
MTLHRNFDVAALNWDEEPRRVKLAQEISDAIMKNLPLSADWDCLDFGCGTGLVTMQLAPSVRTITGIDSSSGMIDKLNEKILRSPYVNIRTEQCTLNDVNMPTARFHLITSAMTLHHIETPVTLFQTFRTFLLPGGWLALADLESEDGTFHEDTTGVFHRGFSNYELTEMLESAGFIAVSISTATSVVKGGREYPVFLCIAQRG